MFEPGIYFGLDEERYHADPALGSGDVKSLGIDPPRWWQKSRHGEAIMKDLGIETSEKEKAHLAFGRAVHTICLEPHRFDSLYAEAEEPPPGLLTTKESIAEALSKTAGARAFKSSDKLEVYEAEARLRDLPLLKDWKLAQEIAARGKEILSPRWVAQIKLIGKVMDMARPDLDGQSVRDHALCDGAGEVSIFWTETDDNGQEPVRCKARIDWLRARGITDLKTYAARDDKPWLQSFLVSASSFAYPIQAAHYIRAWRAMDELVAAGRVYGEPPTGLIEEMAPHLKSDPAWRWLTVQTFGLPDIDILDWSATIIMSAAEVQVREGLANYREYRRRFGLDQPWVAMRGRTVLDDEVMEATGFARRMISRGEQPWLMK